MSNGRATVVVGFQCADFTPLSESYVCLRGSMWGLEKSGGNKIVKLDSGSDLSTSRCWGGRGERVTVSKMMAVQLKNEWPLCVDLATNLIDPFSRPVPVHTSIPV